MLFPSLREGVGVAVIKTAAASVPAVAGSKPGLAEATAPENTEYTFKIDLYDNAAKKVCGLLGDIEVRNNHLENCAKGFGPPLLCRGRLRQLI